MHLYPTTPLSSILLSQRSWDLYFLLRCNLPISSSTSLTSSYIMCFPFFCSNSFLHFNILHCSLSQWLLFSMFFTHPFTHPSKPHFPSRSLTPPLTTRLVPPSTSIFRRENTTRMCQGWTCTIGVRPWKSITWCCYVYTFISTSIVSLW